MKKGGRKGGINPTTPRTIEEIEKFYNFYKAGHSVKETSEKFETDAGYQFKKYNKEIRSSLENAKILRRLGNGYQTKLQYKNLLEEIKTEEDAYILGLWYADGCVHNNQAIITLHKDDEKILEKIRNYICPKLTIKNTVNGDSKILVFSNSYLVSNFIKHGCVTRKTWEELSIPKMPEKLIKHFIRGYFDGDGSIYWDRTYLRFVICAINENILKNFCKILDTLNIENKIDKEIREGKSLTLPSGEKSTNCKDMYRLYVRKKESLVRLYSYLYEDSAIFLKRKKKKFDNFIRQEIKKSSRKRYRTEIIIQNLKVIK